MDDLRELDRRAAELLGWEYHEVVTLTYGVYKQMWQTPDKKHAKFDVPAYSSDPVACAELDGEMLTKGYESCEIAKEDEFYSIYFKPGEFMGLCECESASCFGQKGKTRYEARTRAAVRALEGEK